MSKRPAYLPRWQWDARRWRDEDARRIGAAMSHTRWRDSLFPGDERHMLRWVVGIGMVIAAIVAAAVESGYVTSSFVEGEASGAQQAPAAQGREAERHHH